MPNKYYVNSSKAENQIKKDFEKKDCFAMRSAGSHGKVDVLILTTKDSVYKGKPIMIQYKKGYKIFSGKEKDELIDLATKYKARALFAYRGTDRKLYYQVLS